MCDAGDSRGEHGLGGVREELLSDIVPEIGVGLLVIRKYHRTCREVRRVSKNMKRICLKDYIIYEQK
jgi:hypothetical protein